MPLNYVNRVALESTVISHGLPYPHNLETALALEQVIVEEGSQPATIGIISGEIVVGLSGDQIRRLATASDVRKVSRRDLPIVVARGLDGATTVATTAWAAHRAGIRVFATGGIGGVHRSAAEGPASYLSVDVSADLPELAQTPIIVVCAGAKAILDLPSTLEWLETHGVTVVGYQTDIFPAFYNRDSGLPVDVRADTPEEVADLFRVQRRLELPAGLLVAAPVPAEHELPGAQMETAISRAMADAGEQGVRGKALTPFLLARLSELTGEASLHANLALLKNNAAIAARIACALAA
jgi:pseudouridine-5'-phosphate glycosidase